MEFRFLLEKGIEPAIRRDRTEERGDRIVSTRERRMERRMVGVEGRG